MVVDALGKKFKTNVVKVQQQLVTDAHDVSCSMVRRFVGRSWKCVKAVKRLVLSVAVSFVRRLVRAISPLIHSVCLLWLLFHQSCV